MKEMYFMSNKNNVHLIGIGGISMSSIAKILKRAQVQIGVVITLDGEYYLRKITQKESKKVDIEAIAKEIQTVYSSIKDTLDPAEVKEKLMDIKKFFG